jgi:hypothetical protein
VAASFVVVALTARLAIVANRLNFTGPAYGHQTDQEDTREGDEFQIHFLTFRCMFISIMVVFFRNW